MLTPAQIQTEIATLLPDNNVRAITPAALRQVVNDLTTMAVPAGSVSGLAAVATSGTKADVGLGNVPNVDGTNAGNLSSGTVPAARIAATGPPLVALFEGQSYLTTNQALVWPVPPNLLLWNWDGVDGHVGTAFAAPSGTTINTALSRAAQIARENPTRTVYAVIIGFTGLAISHWLTTPTGIDAYANANANAVAALTVVGVTTINYFGWLQGNGDCGPLNASYVANHKTMMDRNYGNSWFPRETPIDIFSICSTADSTGLNTDADHMNCLLEAVAAADPDKRRYIYMSSLTGATYWDATNPGHPTGQGALSIGKLRGRAVLPQVNVDPASGYVVSGNVSFSGAPYAINLNSVGATLPTTSARVQIVGPDGGNSFLEIDAFGGFSGMSTVASNGTLATPTKITANQLFSSFSAKIHDGVGYTGTVAALNFFKTAADASATDHGTLAQLALTPAGSIVGATYHQWEAGSYTINGLTSGGVKITVPAVAGSGAWALPSATDTFVGKATPDTLTNKTVSAFSNTLTTSYFSAYLSASQTGLGSGTITKVQFNTKEFDPNSYYDSATNFRFNPQLAGKWRISASVEGNGATSISEVDTYIYVNGVQTYQALNLASGVATSTAISKLISFNGSSDYVEIFAAVIGVGALSFIGTTPLRRTWFEAEYVGP